MNGALFVLLEEAWPSPFHQTLVLFLEGFFFPGGFLLTDTNPGPGPLDSRILSDLVCAVMVAKPMQTSPRQALKL